MPKKKTLAKLKQELQKYFNRYIRLRDSEDGYFTCISCNQVKPVDYMDAGHYFAVSGYDGLRFDEDNVHGECKGCNCFDQSHLIGYGINLKKKIGEDRYNLLLKKARDYKEKGNRFNRLEIEEKILYYKQKCNEN